MALQILYSNPGLPVEYALDSDPTVFGGWGGTNAEINSVLYRSDVPSIYLKTGPLATNWTLQATSVGGGINVQDEGVAIANNPHPALNFLGTGVTAADAGAGVASITVPGNVIQEEGVPIAGAPHPTFNFVGTGVTAADAGAGVATITVPGNVIQEEGVPIAGAPHPTFNFVGTGVTATDAGGGIANIVIPGTLSAKFDTSGGTTLTITSQSGQFTNPVFVSTGVYTVDLIPIPGLISANQIVPIISGNTSGPALGVTTESFAAVATITMRIFDSTTGLPAGDNFCMHVQIN